MPLLSDPVVRAAMLARLDRLTPTTRPRWGGLTAPRLLCHLADSFRITFAELDAGPPIPGFASTGIGRWLAISSPLPWPKGIRVPEAFFTTPAETGTFERDRVALRDLIERFADPGRVARWGVSPAFGALSATQWSRLSARHLDHHLRQFGC